MTRRIAIVAAMLAATAAVLAGTAHGTPIKLVAPLERFPMHIGEWTGANAPDLEPAVREALGADAYINRTYTVRQANVGLYLAFYESQERGRAMHSPLNCLPGSGWTPLRHDRAWIEVPRAAPIEVNRYLIEKGLDRMLVFYWYQSHGRVVASEYTAKLHLVSDALRLHRTDGALVRIMTPVPDGKDPAAAETAALAFVRTIFPLLASYLPA